MEQTSPILEESKDNREGNLDHLSAEDQQQLAQAKSEALAANAMEFTLLDMSGQGSLERNELMQLAHAGIGLPEGSNRTLLKNKID